MVSAKSSEGAPKSKKKERNRIIVFCVWTHFRLSQSLDQFRIPRVTCMGRWYIRAVRKLILTMLLLQGAAGFRASAQDASQPDTRHKSKHTMAMPGMQSHNVHTPVADLRNALVAAWNARDLEKVVDLYSESAVIILPTGRLVTGRQSIREYFQQLSKRKGQVSLTSLGSEPGSELQVDFGYFMETISPAAEAEHQADQETEGRYLMIAKKFNSDWKVQEQVMVLSETIKH